MAQHPQATQPPGARLKRWKHKAPPGRKLRRLEHTAFDGTPFYDEELQVPQSGAHRIMIYGTGGVLESVAAEAGLVFLSDEPIWYLDPETE